jgi:riboflavin kinase / FMN adenylyltransferase
MELISSLDHLPTFTRPCGLTFGSFDGVHLGHRVLFRHLRTLLPPHGLVVALAFSTHPSLIVTQRPSPCLITTLEHKLKLLAEIDVDVALSIPFTKEIASWTYSHFLEMLHQKLGFSYLVLGEDATFGKHRGGTQERVMTFAPRLGFHAIYLPKHTVNGIVVSSGYIRNLIAQGSLATTYPFLGRSYSIYVSTHTQKKGDPLSLSPLCLPPSGTYPVHIQCQDQPNFATEVIVQKERAEIDIPRINQCTFPLEMIF